MGTCFLPSLVLRNARLFLVLLGMFGLIIDIIMMFSLLLLARHVCVCVCCLHHIVCAYNFLGMASLFRSDPGAWQQRTRVPAEGSSKTQQGVGLPHISAQRLQLHKRLQKTPCK